MTSLKTSIKTITYLSDIGCLEIQGASLSSNIVDLTGIITSENQKDNKGKGIQELAYQILGDGGLRLHQKPDLHGEREKIT